ncbi:MAG: TetR/AcrR family transcriptional regulator [Clostridiaceae bacterium]|jgi:TetR/AcrR family transcriptional regulator|nr:TetR/AcrR family transcriptional regulator [Clostridiales bacterium]MDD2442128.1 TetR/AcrR family transcriptional regulator [Eubacteriales bacterium]MDD4139481.1 TetR/AcrR family transcriptional regulator [Eubacteriales bacterium]MDD4743554.1 TetR/AcrR family transcriptional regulator [Eubacteriales bacterium]NLB44304.1 TetR/AcrR family transcriptional regulator [Clostridiaceae bacterium]
MSKRERNAEQSRLDILVAAEAEFAGKGLYGARVDEIAALAGINKRMIYAYFGSKEALYKSVLQAVYKRMEAAEAKILEARLDGRDLIGAVIDLYFDFLARDTQFVSIIMWENLNKAAYLKDLPAQDLERPAFTYIREAIAAGKDQGIFRLELDEQDVALSLITACFANFSNCHTLSRLFGRDLCSAEQIEQRKIETRAMMLAYLCL